MDKSLKYYLAGPMSGINQLNFPLFFAVATRLREQGFDIVSPAELDDPEVVEAALKSKGEYTGRGTWGDFLSRDVKLIADDVQGIIFLPDWSKSRGARLEAYVGLNTSCAFGYYSTTKGTVSNYNRRSVAGVVASELTNGFNGT